MTDCYGCKMTLVISLLIIISSEIKELVLRSLREMNEHFELEKYLKYA